jgi:hypothetical protein
MRLLIGFLLVLAGLVYFQSQRNDCSLSGTSTWVVADSRVLPVIECETKRATRWSCVKGRERAAS